MELLIQESSPASEMMDSLGSRTNSRTGMVVPVMRLCMMQSPKGLAMLASNEYECRDRSGSRLPSLETQDFTCDINAKANVNPKRFVGEEIIFPLRDNPHTR